MPPEDEKSLPFLTRKMLAFERATTFDLSIEVLTRLSVTLFIAGYTKEGPFVYRYDTTAAGSIETRNFRIPDVPIAVTVFTTNITVERGDIHIQLYLRMNETRAQLLARGYVFRSVSPSWPQVTGGEAGEGNFTVAAPVGADPAANVEVSISNPTGQYWIVQGGTFTLVTDANAANRRVHLVINSAGLGQVIQCIASVDQAASLTRRYSFAHYGAGLVESSDDDILINIPPRLIIAGNGSITTATVNRQIGDNFSAMTLDVQQLMMHQN